MGLKKHIPNAFTLANLVLGAIAIVYIIEDVKPIYGVYCLVLALIFDFFDGFSARLLNVTSELGKQLDSLADVVSFGLAPSCIAFKLISPGFYQYGQESGSTIWFTIGFVVFIMAAASAYRLAKFNIDTSQAHSFKGLPTPANAIFWIGVLGANETEIVPEFIDSFFIHNPWNLLVLVILLSFLLISNIRMFSLKFKSVRLKGNEWSILMLILGIVLFVFFKWLALPLIVILYIIISIIKLLSKT